MLLNALSVQMEWVWRAVAKYNNLRVPELGAAEMVALNGFICGLSSSEIGELEPNAFMSVLHAEFLFTKLVPSSKYECVMLRFFSWLP